MNLTEPVGATLEAVKQGLQNMTGRINLVFGREHQTDGTHKLPAYKDVVYGTDIGASNFRGDSLMTWTGVTITTLQYWKHGDTYHIDFNLTGTVGGTPSSVLLFDIPGGFQAKKLVATIIRLIDAGTVAPDSFAAVLPEGTTIRIARGDSVAFTAGTVMAAGQLTFRTTA